MSLNGAGQYKATVIITNYDNSKVQASTDVKLESSISISGPIASNITSDSASLSAFITNSKNKPISEIGMYIWENGKSQPTVPTYKTTTNYSNKTITVDTKAIGTSLTAGKTYKYMFYIKSNGRIYTGEQNSFTTQSITSLSFDRKYAAVQVGGTYSLPIKIIPSNSSITPTYNSQDTSIATVDSTGKITGKSTGETTVTATYGNISASIKVRVVGAVSKSNPPIFYDISEYNTVKSWSGMKAAGINYLILRLGITSSFNGRDARVDNSFNSYVENARANNIELGAYYYSKATTTESVKYEANFVLRTLNNYPAGTFSLPIFIDYEESGQPTGQSAANLINEFCNVIENGGYYCGAYTFYYTFDYNLSSSVKARWVPDWTCSGSYAQSVSDLGIWQYAADDSSSCNRPTVYGINFADSNYLYKDFSSAIINSGYNKFQ